MSDRTLALIPARGRSKRIPKKNIVDFFGKPLIAYSIRTALKSRLFDSVIVSTDDEQISKIAGFYGAEVPFIRPLYLADDHATTLQVKEHAISELRKNGRVYDYVCIIYATAPLLDVKYLKEGLDRLKDSDAVNAFSCTPMPFPVQRTFKITLNQRCQMFWPDQYETRSQDLETAYQDAGQFYWSNENKTSKEPMFGSDSIPVVIPPYLVQDIDTYEDLERLKILYEIIKMR